MAFLSVDDQPDPTPLPTREEALAEVADWKRRVDDLYRDVADWLPKDRGYDADRSWMVPVHEPMLRVLGLPPYEIPILQVQRDGKRVLLFRPDARWVMSTHGRVRVGIGDRRWETLLAKEGDSEALEWHYWDADHWRQGGVPWDRERLLTLLGEAR